MKFVVNVIGVAVFLAWLYFFLRYPPRWLARWYDTLRIETPVVWRRTISAMQHLPSTLTRQRVRAALQQLHDLATSETDPLRQLPEFRKMGFPLHDNHWPTIAAENSSLVTLYWNIAEGAYAEREIMWIAAKNSFLGAVWRLRITWWRARPNDDWTIQKWSVDGKPQLPLIADDRFTEKCMLSNMLCAVKTAKTQSSPVTR